MYLVASMKIENTIENMNNDLENVAKFSKNNCLDLNAGKSKYIILGSDTNIRHLKTRTLPPIKIDSKPIDRELSVKNLGITFDETLSFSNHINKLVSNAIGKLKPAFRFKNFLSQ